MMTMMAMWYIHLSSPTQWQEQWEEQWWQQRQWEEQRWQQRQWEEQWEEQRWQQWKWEEQTNCCDAVLLPLDPAEAVLCADAVRVIHPVPQLVTTGFNHDNESCSEAAGVKSVELPITIPRRGSLKDSPGRPGGCSCTPSPWSRWTTADSPLVPWPFQNLEEIERTMNEWMSSIGGLSEEETAMVMKKVCQSTIFANYKSKPSQSVTITSYIRWWWYRRQCVLKQK